MSQYLPGMQILDILALVFSTAQEVRKSIHIKSVTLSLRAKLVKNWSVLARDMAQYLKAYTALTVGKGSITST